MGRGQRWTGRGWRSTGKGWRSTLTGWSQPPHTSQGIQYLPIIPQIHIQYKHPEYWAPFPGVINNNIDFSLDPAPPSFTPGCGVIAMYLPAASSLRRRLWWCGLQFISAERAWGEVGPGKSIQTPHTPTTPTHPCRKNTIFSPSQVGD